MNKSKPGARSLIVLSSLPKRCSMFSGIESTAMGMLKGLFLSAGTHRDKIYVRTGPVLDWTIDNSDTLTVWIVTENSW